MVFREQRWESGVSPSPADALQNYTGGNLTVTGPKETASIFATYPAPYLSLNNGFLDQVSVRERPRESPALCPHPLKLPGLWGWVLSEPPPPQLPLLDKVRGQGLVA